MSEMSAPILLNRLRISQLRYDSSAYVRLNLDPFCEEFVTKNTLQNCCYRLESLRRGDVVNKCSQLLLDKELEIL